MQIDESTEKSMCQNRVGIEGNYVAEAYWYIEGLFFVGGFEDRGVRGPETVFCILLFGSGDS